MRFTKFGKAFLMSAISAGVILGITSCVQSYSVGYLYVTGTNTASQGNNGIVSGFKIDHNKGKLTPINGIPVSSGGANPIRATLLTGGRFLYVLNRGKNAEGNADCATADPCAGSNVALFSIGGNGVLASQGQVQSTQGFNPMRMFTDSSGSYLYVLDHDSPDNYAASYNPATNACTLALGTGVKTCGDITVFKIDPNTGRLTLVVNAQVTSASGAPLTYFPVPEDPIDFVLSGSYVITLSGTPATGDSAFPYTYNATNGQLAINQNSSQPLNIGAATAIVSAGGSIFVLDNETLTRTINGTTTTAASWVFQYTVASNGALQPTTNGVTPDSASLSNPIYLIVESKGKWAYMANYGNSDTASGNTQSGITGYVVDPASKTLSEIPGSPFGSGSGPSCLLEDPSNQFIYTANFIDSTLTGSSIDQNSGLLRPLPGSANKTYPVEGPPTWCVTTGRTS
jgi:6-phosphogluconolactonase (cycloisomerase 2 family)